MVGLLIALLLEHPVPEYILRDLCASQALPHFLRGRNLSLSPSENLVLPVLGEIKISFRHKN